MKQLVLLELMIFHNALISSAKSYLKVRSMQVFMHCNGSLSTASNSIGTSSYIPVFITILIDIYYILYAFLSIALYLPCTILALKTSFK